MGRATTRISLKTIAMMFPSDSIERVYLHGKWQIERGRNPSMVFGNHYNPRNAFVVADEMLGNYFDEIRHQVSSRSEYFWDQEMIDGVMKRTPVRNLVPSFQYQSF